MRRRDGQTKAELYAMILVAFTVIALLVANTINGMG